MKRFFVMGKQIMLAAVLFAGLSLTSCDKDDPEPDQPNNEQPTPTPDPDPDPTPTPNPDPDPDPTPTPDPTPAGNKALHITQAKVDGYWMGQLLSAIQLEEGSYTLTAKVYTKTDLVLRTSFADLDNGEDKGFDCIATNFTGSEEAQNLSVDFTLTKAAADFKLWFGNQDCDFWIDDMVLVKKDDTKNLFKFSDFSGENDINFWRNQYNHELTFEVAELSLGSTEPAPNPDPEPTPDPEPEPSVGPAVVLFEASEAEMKPHGEWSGVDSEGKFVGLNKFKAVPTETLKENAGKYIVLKFFKTADAKDDAFAQLGGNCNFYTNASDVYGSAIADQNVGLTKGKAEGDNIYYYVKVDDLLAKLETLSDALGSGVANWWNNGEGSGCQSITIEDAAPVEAASSSASSN